MQNGRIAEIGQYFLWEYSNYLFNEVSKRFNNLLPEQNPTRYSEKQLEICRLNNKRSLRLELMKHLNNIGYLNREIKDFLNVSNIKKVRTNTKYTPKLIWMTLKNYNIRLLRKNDNILQIRESLYVNFAMSKYEPIFI